jgi:hypothetical protein
MNRQDNRESFRKFKQDPIQYLPEILIAILIAVSIFGVFLIIIY